MINEFTAKKLGEVLAFCRVELDTIERGRQAWETVFDVADIDRVVADTQERAAKIEAFAQANNVSDITLAKADGTGAKLKSMRDLYVGDEWDNATELLEWSGFFEGAAIVHWVLVAGAAEGLGNDELKHLAELSKEAHIQIHDSVSTRLRNVGKKRSQA